MGGLPQPRFLEDEALCQALRRHDLALRHSPHVQVLTSARRQGRVEVGLSWQLREWLNMSRQQREPHVESPVQLAALWLMRRQLRAYWRSQPLLRNQVLATRLGLPATTLLTQTQRAATFGKLWEWACAHGTRTAVASLQLSLALLALPRLIRHYQKFLVQPEVTFHAEPVTFFPASRASSFRVAVR